MLTLADIVQGLTGQRPPELERQLTRVSVDSRDLAPGEVFIALRGERADGHDYVSDALEKGASMAIVERQVGRDLPGTVVDLRPRPPQLPEVWQLPALLLVPGTLNALHELAGYWRRRHSPRVIGITGSVGKTTTKELTADVLSRRYLTLKSARSYNNEIGLPLTLLQLTPEHQQVVLEMGMYDVGEITDLAQIALPHVGVVTIIGPVHLERAGSMERIVQAKAELVQALPPGPKGVAILNHDDPRVLGMRKSTRARVFTYGLSRDADLRAGEIEGLGLEGVRFEMHYRDEHLHVKVPLLGRHSVHTALRAAAVGLVEGLAWQEIVEGLRSPTSQLRLAAVPGPRGSTILDDTYNASPASTIAALNLLEELEGRKIAVLGDMLELGDYEQEGHEKVGMRALEVVDILITVGNLARVIGETARRWGMPRERVHTLDDNSEAIALLRDTVAEGDVVLVKGSRLLQMEGIVSALGGS
jgi:UDP-N-acetylmuramoyl-tripeptide--D-alanyl-D-alanine ligase